MQRKWEAIQQNLMKRKDEALFRENKEAVSSQKPERVVNGKEVLSFNSNDYLGLAGDVRLREAMTKAALKYGVGSGASHLLGGHTDEHTALEEELADFLERDRVLLFSTGYMANLGIIQAMVGRKGDVFADRLNHASLVDAGVLARAKVHRYYHSDMQNLQQKLEQYDKGASFVVSDGVFSMDGDVANVSQLVAFAKNYEAWLMIDDAHGLGVLGETGGGTLEQVSLSQEDVPILMGTFGKAFGTFGAFVAGKTALIEYIQQYARSSIYTTAMPAALVAATRVSLDIVKKEHWRREKLQWLIESFRTGAAERGISLMVSNTPIQPVSVGSNQAAIEVSAELWEKGVYVSPIRPPTVPEGTARLRVALSALHEESHIEQLLECLERSVVK
ncbi:MAG: 8-amino-7-oxononanoate synthase (EC [uncultured Thiotrichaceae bacterium]|uniref:8-amino-7-oxononanoate synthase n=1 Tax=uncultured Thiotrichaceae bacterium TaxID=298394 RepID=A0A6S6SPY3_9GAMM|nr:MAG: 8-amino-7-oxononanoate synthase (EC [uncultured Thiotrichaceae bacterium]